MAAFQVEIERHEAQLLAQFRRELRRFLQFSEEAAGAAGLLPQQHQLMLQIAGAPNGVLVTVGHVATALGLRHNTTVELSKRCERMGLVQRTTDSEDRRRVVLELTDKGHAALRQLSSIHAQQLRELASGLIPALIQIRDSKPATGGPETTASHN